MELLGNNLDTHMAQINALGISLTGKVRGSEEDDEKERIAAENDRSIKMFDSIRLSLADPETIRGWAMGEVKKA